MVTVQSLQAIVPQIKALSKCHDFEIDSHGTVITSNIAPDKGVVQMPDEFEIDGHGTVITSNSALDKGVVQMS